MKYKSVKIENLKGIKNTTIDFTNNRILTLVGLNESGKTTILEGIKLFDRLVKGERLKKKDYNQIRPKGIAFSEYIKIEVDLEFEEDDYENLKTYLKVKGKKSRVKFPTSFKYEYRFEYHLHKYVRTTSLATFEAQSDGAKTKLFNSNKELWLELIEHIKVDLIPDILYYEDFIFQIPDKITFNFDEYYDDEDYEDEDEDDEETVESQEENEEWKSVLDDILKSILANFESFQKNVVDIWKTDNDTARQIISAMEMQLDKVITNAWKELFDKHEKSSQSKRLNFKEIKIICDPSESQLNISFKIKAESGKEFSINERSKGFKWFFSFLIFTEFRKNRANNILFLLDEPASNLHSSAQSKILDAISQLSDKSMIVYSTHSQHLINPIWLKGAYVVINEAISSDNLEGALTDTDAKITIQKYYDYVSKSGLKAQTLYFQPILDRLDYKPGSMEAIPGIVICEGKYDWYTFKYIAEIILEDSYEYNFYPGAGKDSHWEIIRLYLSWGWDFVLLLDGDKSGQKSKETYQNEFRGFLENRVYTLKDIIQAEVEMEEIFQGRDHQIICDTAFGEGTYYAVKGNRKEFKSKFNFSIVQLLQDQVKVDLQEETIARFSAILNFLKNHKQGRLN